jgi:anti-sigma B factor antagonist
MKTLEIEKREQVCILKYSGELTLEVIDQLREESEEYLLSENCQVLVMDLSKTVFLDSSGIGFLVHLNNRKKSNKKQFYLFKPSPQVRKTLSLVKLIDFFNLLDSEEDLDFLVHNED